MHQEKKRLQFQKRETDLEALEVPDRPELPAKSQAEVYVSYAELNGKAQI
jgi:hypothetical protein